MNVAGHFAICTVRLPVLLLQLVSVGICDFSVKIFLRNKLDGFYLKNVYLAFYLSNQMPKMAYKMITRTLQQNNKTLRPILSSLWSGHIALFLPSVHANQNVILKWEVVTLQVVIHRFNTVFLLVIVFGWYGTSCTSDYICYKMIQFRRNNWGAILYTLSWRKMVCIFPYRTKWD